MILTLSVLSHFTVFHFKALNLPKVTTTTQTVESPVKMKRDELERLFRAQS